MLLGRKSSNGETMKKILLILALIAMLAVPFVSADFEVSKVYVNTVEATSDNKVQVELDTAAQVQVQLEGTGSTKDVNIKVWLGGYEYDNLEDYTEMFDVEDGVVYKKNLEIHIPEDLDVTSNEYTLRVEVFDAHSREVKEYTLYFEQERHRVIVEDILLSTDAVEAGEPVGVKVRLENQGETFEEDLKVTISVPELGISKRVYLDELETNDQDETRTVFLTIPQDAQEGNYEISVVVDYNNGHSESADFTYLTIDNDGTQYDEYAVVSISPITDLKQGKESTFKVQVTNFEETTKTFYLDVQGVTADFEKSVSVAGGSTTDIYFTITPEEPGVQNIFVTLCSDVGIVSEKQYSVDVERSNAWKNTILALVLAILALVAAVVFNRLR